MAQVFISYKREDRPAAKAVATQLIAKGYDVWWDADLLPGADFQDETKQILNEAEAVIVLWSEASALSRSVRSEAGIARTNDTLISVSLDDAVPPLPFDKIETLSLADWDGTGGSSEIAELTRAVETYAGAPARTPVSERMVAAQVDRAEDTWKVFWARVRDTQPEQREAYQRFLELYADTADAEVTNFAQRRSAALSAPSPWRRSAAWLAFGVASFATAFALTWLFEMADDERVMPENGDEQSVEVLDDRPPPDTGAETPPLDIMEDRPPLNDTDPPRPAQPETEVVDDQADRTRPESAVPGQDAPDPSPPPTTSGNPELLRAVEELIQSGQLTPYDHGSARVCGAGDIEETVNYGVDGEKLNEAILSLLPDVLSEIGSCRVKTVLVSGHTDSAGRSDENQPKSAKRAADAAAALVRAGVPEGFVTSEGLGEMELLIRTGDGVREQLNRRIVVRATFE